MGTTTYIATRNSTTDINNNAEDFIKIAASYTMFKIGKCFSFPEVWILLTTVTVCCWYICEHYVRKCSQLDRNGSLEV